jgi:hypothetical protein
MNTAKALEYEKACVNSAILWATGEDTIYGGDCLAIICEHFKMKLPKTVYTNFLSSDSENQASCTGAEKSIFKFMTNLCTKILESEGYKENRASLCNLTIHVKRSVKQ